MINGNVDWRDHRRQRRALLIAICAIVPAFAFTDVLVRFSKERRHQMAAEWATRGEDAITHHRTDEAIEDLSTALAYGADDTRTRLRLADALVLANRRDVARLQLLALREEQPTDGPVAAVI